MKPPKILHEVKNLLDLLLRADIALHVNAVVCRSIGGGIERVTWGAPSSSAELFRGEFATVDDYCAWLEAQAYSALLFDGAILQISYDCMGDAVEAHRLGFYPCPYDVDEQLLRAEPALDVIELYRAGGDSLVKLRTPLRIDYDLKSMAPGHPAAHMSLLWAHCRWALVSPISPGHFIRFVFRHFYPGLWTAHEFIRSWPQRLSDRTITAEEEGLLHVAYK